ncbi:hypothetical protein D3C73_1651500 [compost metagenome]
MGNAVERWFVEFFHYDAAVLSDVVFKQVHKTYLLGREAWMGMEEALEMLLDCLCIQTDNLAHG